MRQFEYTVRDPLGIHARPAGLLSREAKRFSSVCTVTKGEKTNKLTQLMLLMSMGIKQGDTVTVRADGPDEKEAITALRLFFETHL